MHQLSAVDRIRIERDICLLAGGVFAEAVAFMDSVAEDIDSNYCGLMLGLIQCADDDDGGYIHLGENQYSCDGERLWTSFELITGSRLKCDYGPYSPFSCAC